MVASKAASKAASEAANPSLPIATPSVWLDVVCASAERAASFQLAANELGVSVEMLQRWVLRMAMRKAGAR